MNPIKMNSPPEEQGLLDSAQIEHSIRAYLDFESETSILYPFLKTPDQVSPEKMQKIVELCGGFDDTETVYESCLQVLGNACEEISHVAKPERGATQKKNHTKSHTKRENPR